MSLNSIGDLAQGFALRRQNTVFQRQIERLSHELASGLTSDVTEKLSGDFMRLADIEHRLHLSQTYQRGADQGRIETSAMQLSLEAFQTTTEALSSTAVLFATSSGAAGLASIAQEARGALGAMISALNVQMGGRSLFAGDNVSASPLAQAEDFLTAIQTAVAGAASAADVTTALDAFFDPGGGFETLVYQGGSTARSAYQLGEGESVSLDLRADDPALRAAFKQVAIVTILDDPGVTLSSGDQFALIADVGIALLSNQSQITNIRADLGFAEGRIDRAATRLAAEMASLSLVQNELLAIDPFETASDLESVQTRLETLYAITSRMSRLNLVNYL